MEIAVGSQRDGHTIAVGDIVRLVEARLTADSASSVQQIHLDEVSVARFVQFYRDELDVDEVVARRSELVVADEVAIILVRTRRWLVGSEHCPRRYERAKVGLYECASGHDLATTATLPTTIPA